MTTMTTMNTNELTGPALDWAVAKCEGKTLHYFVDDPFGKDPWLAVNGEADQPLRSFTPSTDWGQGGKRIEREKIDVFWQNHQHAWVGSMSRGSNKIGFRHLQYGPTPLIAAMRCYVASKLGATVEVPNELQP